MNRQKIISQIAEEYPNKTEDSIKKLVRRRKKIDEKYFIVKNFKNDREGFDISQFNEDNIILLTYYQHILKSSFKVKMPNRNHIIDELLNIAPYVNKYNEQTIYKFDLKSFYKSVDVNLVVKKIAQNQYLYSNEINFISTTFSNLDSLFPGIGIINYMVEILGQDFDITVKNIFKDSLVFYSRYIDDCILILDKQFDKSVLENILTIEIKKHFGNEAKFNESKSCFINLSSSEKFDYLGYLFQYDITVLQNGKRKCSFLFGVASKKIVKEKERVKKIVTAYQKDLNEELLFTRLDLYFKRLVYLNKKMDWEVRGISQTYSEAKKLLQWDKTRMEYYSTSLIPETYSFFKGEFLKDIFRDLNLLYPQKIENQVMNGKFSTNLALNKAVVLHQKVGYNHQMLYDILNSLDLQIDTSMSYRQLASIYKKEVYNLQNNKPRNK